MMAGDVLHRDYEGLVPSDDELARLGAKMKDHRSTILRRHGIFAWGRTIPESFTVTFNLERVCEIQIAAVQNVDFNQAEPAENHVLLMGWGAVLRLLARLDPGFRE